MDAKIQRSVNIIDQVINNITLPLAVMSETEISILFSRVFSHKDADLVKHYIGEFVHNNRKNFGGWFFSCEPQIIRELFEYYEMDMEPDQYPDSAKRYMAQIKGKSKEETLPFEYYIIYQFYLMAGNNSLQLLEKIVPEAYNRIETRGMDLYGNGVNWSKAWNVLSDAERKRLVDYLLNEYKG